MLTFSMNNCECNEQLCQWILNLVHKSVVPRLVLNTLNGKTFRTFHIHFSPMNRTEFLMSMLMTVCGWMIPP